MASAGLQPWPVHEPGATGKFLTFVFPTANGCNLNCPFCLVRQRREITNTQLRPADFARFIREVAEREAIYALAIQGYEPLLPEALAYTRAVLATGRFLRLPTGLVTNGVKLLDAIDLLTTLSPNKIAVSLDAASAKIHDHIRGVPGTWVAAVEGIKHAIDILAPRTKLVVSSVLLPLRRHYLDSMPAVLRDIGIERWIINPLLRVGSNRSGGPVADRVGLFHDLLILQEAADRAGIRLTVDDEFDHLRHDAANFSQPALRRLHVRTLPPNVEIFRLAPSGQCATGDNILKRVTPETPQWRPHVVHAADFITSLSELTNSRHGQTA
jgi:MoaA/NifB/PqqE/SkfB family radical SAM enzyme